MGQFGTLANWVTRQSGWAVLDEQNSGVKTKSQNGAGGVGGSRSSGGQFGWTVRIGADLTIALVEKNQFQVNLVDFCIFYISKVDPDENFTTKMLSGGLEI